ncbi:MAG: hypothetical protein GEU75_13415 [Dehalococcoidia bacterium]|nr:hypothetical protein [Dehalococcoidia bacterium]
MTRPARLHTSIASLILFLGFWLVGVPPVLADDPDGPYVPDPNAPRAEASVSVQSSGGGVTIRIAVQEASPGSQGSGIPVSGGGGSTSSGEAWDCRVDIMNIGNATRAWFVENAPQHPGHAPWVVNCTNGYMNIVWLPATTDDSDINIVIETGDPSVDPLLLAAELLDEIPVPDIEIGANPATGMVAVPSWFWLDGYDGSPIVESAALAGITVEVEITPTSSRWVFGDGATLSTASFGAVYPEPSDIRHTYERSSLSAGGAYAVSVDLTFAVRFRVVGEDWQDLEPITRSFSSEYPVRQLQSVLTGE